MLFTEYNDFADANSQSPLSYMLSIDNYIGILLFAGFPILFIWIGMSGIKGILDTEEDAPLMETLFDSNGGFFWSDWQY